MRNMAQSKKKTTDKIKDSLVALLEGSPLDDITVTALCEKAGINRATFYYHYDSVNAVFDEIENQIEDEFNRFLTRTAINDDSAPEKSFYVMFFEFVARNATICKMILNSPHSGNSSFLTRAMEGGRYKVTEMMSKLYPDCPKSKIDFYYIFVSHGFRGLLEYWLNSGMREPIDSIAEVGERVSYMGAKYLEE
ncbi:MAG: TetR/AcrR family transcriptional regulator [Clostridiales bacterium]|nr:TetR/AcrR family transcriptional regulator [Clostridiales bacterium]